MSVVPECLLLTRRVGQSLEFLVPSQQNIKIHVMHDGTVLVEDMNLGADMIAFVQNA
jgi:hypothetical protein